MHNILYLRTRTTRPIRTWISRNNWGNRAGRSCSDRTTTVLGRPRFRTTWTWYRRRPPRNRTPNRTANRSSAWRHYKTVVKKKKKPEQSHFFMYSEINIITRCDNLDSELFSLFTSVPKNSTRNVRMLLVVNRKSSLIRIDTLMTNF